MFYQFPLSAVCEVRQALGEGDITEADVDEYNMIVNRNKALQAFLNDYEIKEDIIAYRFVSPVEFHKHLMKLPFKLYPISEFFSTTMSQEKYDGSQRSPFCIKLLISKGVHGVYIPNINGTKEYEVLINAGSHMIRRGWKTFEIIE